MSEAIRNLFDAISPTYDKLNHVLSFNIDKSWRKKAVATIARDPNDKFRVLDLCAGTFDLSLECLHQYPNAVIDAVDFSQSMLDAGLTKILKPMSEKKITPLCADALNLPFEAESFDVVMCAYGVRNLDDTNKAIIEARRVLKPGGQLVILEFFKPDSPLSKFFHTTYAQVVVPVLGKIISKNDKAYSYLRDSIRGFITRRELDRILETSNFYVVVSRDLLMGISSIVTAKKI